MGVFSMQAVHSGGGSVKKSVIKTVCNSPEVKPYVKNPGQTVLKDAANGAINGAKTGAATGAAVTARGGLKNPISVVVGAIGGAVLGANTGGASAAVNSGLKAHAAKTVCGKKN